jgi:hypothetical protein
MNPDDRVNDDACTSFSVILKAHLASWRLCVFALNAPAYSSPFSPTQNGLDQARPPSSWVTRT